MMPKLLPLMLLLVSWAVFHAAETTFYDDDPIAVEPETQDASQVNPWKIDLMYDLIRNQFARPGEPVGRRAHNINTIDDFYAVLKTGQAKIK